MAKTVQKNSSRRTRRYCGDALREKVLESCRSEFESTFEQPWNPKLLSFGSAAYGAQMRIELELEPVLKELIRTVRRANAKASQAKGVFPYASILGSLDQEFLQPLMQHEDFKIAMNLLSPNFARLYSGRSALSFTLRLDKRLRSRLNRVGRPFTAREIAVISLLCGNFPYYPSTKEVFVSQVIRAEIRAMALALKHRALPRDSREALAAWYPAVAPQPVRKPKKRR